LKAGKGKWEDMDLNTFSLFTHANGFADVSATTRKAEPRIKVCVPCVAITPEWSPKEGEVNEVSLLKNHTSSAIQGSAQNPLKIFEHATTAFTAAQQGLSVASKPLHECFSKLRFKGSESSRRENIQSLVTFAASNIEAGLIERNSVTPLTPSLVIKRQAVY
jgi:hypothetical protein